MNSRLKLFMDKENDTFLVVAYDIDDAILKSNHIPSELEQVANNRSLTIIDETFTVEYWIDRLGRGVYHTSFHQLLDKDS